MRPGTRDVLWLALAVLLHAMLLLVPPRQTSAPLGNSHVLSVELLAPAATDPRAEKPRPVAKARQMAVQPKKSSSRAAALISDETPPLASKPFDTGPEDTATTTTVARLIDSASQLKWNRPDEDEHRKLGEFVPPAAPANWRPGIAVEDNRFDDTVAPAATEIVDQWLAADGSQNLVIRTPTGHTLCGRARAWDPMNPLFEPVMMYRPCGGGGKRTFRMPHRYRESRQAALSPSSGP